MTKRRALLIGITTFDDSKAFPNLRTPANDVLDFANVLEKYGKFEIAGRLVDASSDAIRYAIEELYADAERGDLTLLYYSGHGYKDRYGNLNFVAKDTMADRILSTGVSEGFINEAMSHSRSRHRIAIFDSCFSGAFLTGKKSGEEPLLFMELKGEATIILASTGSIQYSFYEEDGRNSLFTKYLIDGIITGLGGKSKSGLIPIDELFDYSSQKVKEVRPEQTPTMAMNRRESKIHIAFNPTSIETKPLISSRSDDSSKTDKRKIKILFLAANPLDSTRLRLDKEIREIDHALRLSEFRDRFGIEQQWAVQVTDLQGHLLRYKPDIVHFSGHGSEISEIILENSNGESQPVPAKALSQLFSVLKDNIRCVVLNACYSEEQADGIAEHIDCVIGMSKAIGDSAAISFATAFYQALGYGRNVKTAFDLGCILIDLENLGEQDTPKLIAKKSNPEVVIFTEQ